nr:pleurain-a1 antimicrobial peptide precursor [Nidirana pleuraden]
MFTLKKTLLLLFFLGTISISLCKQEGDADEDDGRKMTEEEVKRSIITMTKEAKLPQLWKQIACRLYNTC